MDSKAVSPLIGFVLLLAIIMGLIGIMQSQWVPEWNKAVEAEHLDEVSYEVAELSEVVSLAASTGNPAKIVINAGVKYPEYYILISPSKAAGSVGKRELWVNISGIADSTSYTKNFTTYAITYRPNYLYSSSPELVFEHSAVLKMENSYLVVNSDQSSFTRSKITLYLINATFNPFSTTDNINLVFYPISYGGSTRFSGTIEFVCYDERTASWWNETLSSIYGSDNVTQDGRRITLNVNNVELSINYFVATATSAGEVEIVSEMSPAELQPLSESSYTVYEGTTVPLGVRVIDEFNNPVRNEVVNIDVNPNTPSNSDGSKVSDNKGEIWYYFNAESSGSYTITFSIPSDSLSYSVNVNSPPTGGSGCIFNAYWMEGDSLTWNVSQEGASKTLNFKVIYGSDPVYNAQVYFAIDNTSVVSASKYDGRTDPSGIAQITLNAIANGDVSVIGTVASCTDVINLTVEGVSGANQPPVANFTYSPSYPEEGDTVTFDASASYDPDGSIVSYNWNFGDGSIGSGQTVQHVYSQAGTYTVTLNVTDDSGLTTSIQKTVSVGGLVYNNDAVAVDGDDSPNPDRKGGVIFTVTNKYSTTVEIYSITIDPPDNIDYLDDQLTPNNQPGRTEIYIEADTSSYVDFHGGVYIPNNGLTVDLDIDGDERSGTNAELNSGSKATFYLYEFFNKNGKNVNMANKQIVITIYYIVNGENKVKTFTITPS